MEEHSMQETKKWEQEYRVTAAFHTITGSKHHKYTKNNATTLDNILRPSSKLAS